MAYIKKLLHTLFSADNAANPVRFLASMGTLVLAMIGFAVFGPISSPMKVVFLIAIVVAFYNAFREGFRTGRNPLTPRNQLIASIFFTALIVPQCLELMSPSIGSAF